VSLTYFTTHGDLILRVSNCVNSINSDFTKHHSKDMQWMGIGES